MQRGAAAFTDRPKSTDSPASLDCIDINVYIYDLDG